jgi:hypothetical protein
VRSVKKEELSAILCATMVKKRGKAKMKTMPPEPTSYERGLAKLAEVDGQAGQQVMHFYKAAESPIACDFGVSNLMGASKLRS